MDQYSELFYDPTPLLEAVKKQSEVENAEEQQQQHSHHQQPHQSNSRHHTPRSEREFHIPNVHHQMGPPGHDPSIQQHHRHHAPPVNYPYPSTPTNMNMQMRGPTPMSRPYPGGPPGAPFNPIPPNQFYNENSSPMRMAPMGGIGMMDHGHNIGGHNIGGHTMGGGMQGMGMGIGMGGSGMGGGGMPGGMGGGNMGGGGMGGMPGMPMNLSPEATRRVTRGMIDDSFPM